MIDEGYTKFDVRWNKAPGVDGPLIRELNLWRGPLYEAGLIGHDAELDVGYGNLSIRDGDGFLISGTQTGHLAQTGADHYARVTAVDIPGNRVSCIGPVQASSESMTHAAIYAVAPAVGAVVHAHHEALWRTSRDRIPTTSAAVAYGTPEMARELARLLAETPFTRVGIAAMGGHEAGLIAVGENLEEATRRMLSFAESGPE